jgi:hypothetical protein
MTQTNTKVKSPPFACWSILGLMPHGTNINGIVVWILVFGAWNFHNFIQTGKIREIGQQL